jgi:hypothetical protein
MQPVGLDVVDQLHISFIFSIVLVTGNLNMLQPRPFFGSKHPVVCITHRITLSRLFRASAEVMHDFKC